MGRHHIIHLMALLVLAAGCGHESYFLGSPDHQIDIPPDTVDPVVPDTIPPDVPTECADSDGDGVCDYADRCPGHDDRLDADGDTIPDGCDACLIGDDRRDTDGDGVPDACDCDYVGIICDPNASCMETGVAPTCVCNPGYEGDGFTCTPIITDCDTYTDSFTYRVTPTTVQCTDWLTFTSGLATSGYSSVTMSGTLDTTGITCSDPTAAQQIADALRTNMSALISCDGHQWSYCKWDTYGEIWIDPPSLCSGSNCPDPGYIIRPCIGNKNWGGVLTATCSGPSQTLNLDFCI